jgi:hypothetical protein
MPGLPIIKVHEMIRRLTMKRRYIYFILTILTIFGACASSTKGVYGPDTGPEIIPLPQAPVQLTAASLSHPEALPPPVDDNNLPVSEFKEVWAYLVAGREASFKESYPISDIGYFGADVSVYGQLINVPKRSKLGKTKSRVHLVVTCGSQSLTHVVLREPNRSVMVKALVKAAADYDGLQIDFEYIPAQDGAVFRTFLKEIKASLGRDKIFSLAIPARTSKINNDIYDYALLKPIADKILVMAYDEHWSTSKPGPIASMDWCQRVAKYALSVIGPEKLIMGLPFYGRSWADVNHAKAHIFSNIETLKREHQVTAVKRVNSVPTFTYEAPVQVTVYYEDDHSISMRMYMY